MHAAIIIANRRERALVHGQSNKWREEGSYRRSYHIIIQAEHGWGERRQGECSIGDATKSTLLQELNFEGTLSLDKAVHG